MSGFTLDIGPWVAYTPAVIPTTGAITTYTASGRYKKIGKTVFFRLYITVTTNGTGAGALQCTLPAASGNLDPNLGQVAIGINSTSLVSLFGFNPINTASLNIRKYDGTYPVVSGDTVCVSGAYEAA